MINLKSPWEYLTTDDKLSNLFSLHNHSLFTILILSKQTAIISFNFSDDKIKFSDIFPIDILSNSSPSLKEQNVSIFEPPAKYIVLHIRFTAQRIRLVYMFLL